MTIIERINKNRWFTFLCLIVFTILCYLGTWQVNRLTWKLKLIEKTNQSTIAQIVDLSRDVICFYRPECSKSDRATPPDFTKVRITGTFITTIPITAKYHQGKLGYHLISPMKIANENYAVFVNRGWIPADKKDVIYTGPEQVIIEGIIMPQVKKPFWFPKNKPETNFWIWADLEAMKDYINVHIANPVLETYPVLIQQTQPKSENPPITLSDKLEIRNDHLEYAITWYSLALITVVMYFFFIFRKDTSL